MKKKRRTTAEIWKAMDDPKFTSVHIQGTWIKKADKKNGAMLEGGFVLCWGAKDVGFGTLTFRQKVEGPKVEMECESEHMGRDFVRKALEHFAKTVEIVE